MIRIDSRPVPEILTSPVVWEHRQRLLAYLRRPEAARLSRRPPIADELFYHRELWDAVAERCSHKCAFCEAAQISNGVQHFRPPRVRDIGDGGNFNHYAWLAYEWNNLISMCEYCSRAREDRFPVIGERAPYLASFEEVRRLEAPLLVDPYHDAPDRHFDFLMDGRCAPLTDRGRATTTLFELGGERLREQRQDDLGRLQMELSSRAEDGGWKQVEDAFDRRRPFAGARLNVLRRALEGMTFFGKSMRGPARLLPTRMARFLASGIEERRRVLARLDDLRKADEAREVEQDHHDYLTVTRSVPPEERRMGVRSMKPRHVGRIEVSNLKGIDHLRIEGNTARRTRRGAPCLMLLGENATGKSTVLQGIALALLGGPQARRLRLTADDFLRSRSTRRWDQLDPEPASLKVGFLFDEGHATIEFDGTQRRIVGSAPPATLVLGYGPRRYFDRRRTAAASQPYACVRTLFDPLATIPYPGVWLNSLPDDQFDAVVRALRPILALSDNDELVRDTDGRICVKVEDRPVPIERLSEGYRSVFALAADIFRQMLNRFRDLERAHGVVLVDEIETHLHPRWKMQVMRALRRALPNVQFIVTTHDPLCLRGMEDGEVVVLQRDADGEIALLQGLPGLKGMRAEQLLTSDYFGLSSTIDPETELEVARFAAEVAERPDEHVTSEAVSRLTLGDSAGEQVVQAALQRFLDRREKPAGSLRTDVRAEAVEAVYRALAAPPSFGPGEPERGPA
ncbi:AAA family ATPase [Methylobacterium sp. D54C]